MIKERYGLYEILKSIKISIDFKIFKERERYDEKDEKTLFKNNDVFAEMLNNDIKKITVNRELEKITMLDLENKETLILKLMSTNEIESLFRLIQDKALMDISIRKGTQESIMNPKFGNLISKVKFKTEQIDHIITVEILEEIKKDKVEV